MVRKLGVDALKGILVIYGPLLSKDTKPFNGYEAPLEQQIEELLEVIKYDKVSVQDIFYIFLYYLDISKIKN